MTSANDPASILLCLPPGTEHYDPEASQTHGRDVALVTSWRADTIGVAGWSSGGLKSGSAMPVAAQA